MKTFICEIEDHADKLGQLAEECLKDFESSKRPRFDVLADLRSAARECFGEFIDAIKAIPEEDRKAPPDDAYFPKRNDPALYRELSEAFNCEDEADEALTAFFNEVGRSRKKNGIPDVVIAFQVSVVIDGKEQLHMGTCQFGSELMHEPIAAYAFAKLRNESKARIEGLLNGPSAETRDEKESACARSLSA